MHQKEILMTYSNHVIMKHPLINGAWVLFSKKDSLGIEHMAPGNSLLGSLRLPCGIFLCLRKRVASIDEQVQPSIFPGKARVICRAFISKVMRRGEWRMVHK